MSHVIWKIEMRHEELLQDIDMQSDPGSPARERGRRGEELRMCYVHMDPRVGGAICSTSVHHVGVKPYSVPLAKQ